MLNLHRPLGPRQRGRKWLHLATLDARHKKCCLAHICRKYSHFACHLLALLCGIGDGKEPTVNASLLHLCALNMEGDEIMQILKLISLLNHKCLVNTNHCHPVVIANMRNLEAQPSKKVG